MRLDRCGASEISAALAAERDLERLTRVLDETMPLAVRTLLRSTSSIENASPDAGLRCPARE
jgi:hypothetical protein